MTRAGWSLAALAFAGLLAAGCGGGGGGSSPGSPTAPTAPTAPQVQTQTFTGTVGIFGIVSHEVTASRDGSLTATLTWVAAVDLDLYLTDASCTGYPPEECAILARSVAATGNREEVRRSVRSGERFKVWVDNFSRDTAASYSVTVEVR